jgi:hypothetical protein
VPTKILIKHHSGTTYERTISEGVDVVVDSLNKAVAGEKLWTWFTMASGGLRFGVRPLDVVSIRDAKIN